MQILRNLNNSVCKILTLFLYNDCSRNEGSFVRVYSVGRKKIRPRSSRNTWWRSKPLIIQRTGVVSHAKNKKQHKDSSSCIGCDCISIFWGRLLIAVPYFFLLMISCIAIMGMTGWCDLLMYVPHIIIIGLTIFIATRQLAYENKSDTQNENGNI